jgi:hypothetical protein
MGLKALKMDFIKDLSFENNYLSCHILSKLFIYTIFLPSSYLICSHPHNTSQCMPYMYSTLHIRSHEKQKRINEFSMCLIFNVFEPYYIPWFSKISWFYLFSWLEWWIACFTTISLRSYIVLLKQNHY